MKENIFNLSIGFLGSIITYAFGGWSEMMSFLLVCFVIDWLTGIAASIREGKGVNSQVGFWGIAKKGLMLLVIMMAHRIDVLMGADLVMSGAIYFYIANELISITENYGRLGLPLPNKLKEIITVLKEKGGSKEEESDQDKKQDESKKE